MAQKIIQSIPYPYYTTIQRDELLDIEVNFKINNSTTGKVEEWDGTTWAESGGGAGLTPEQAADLAAATEHIDGVDEEKHVANQIINAAALPNLGLDAGAKQSVINALIGSGTGITPEQAQDLTDSKIENIFFTALSPDYGVVTRPYNFKVTTKVDTGGIATIKTSADAAYTLNNTILAGGYLKVTADTLLMRTHLTIERAI